jgi:hypothetical protein
MRTMSTEFQGSAPEGTTGGPEEMPPPPPDEPTDDAGLRSDGSVLDEAPDTTTGKQHLMQNDEGRPGPGV